MRRYGGNVLGNTLGALMGTPWELDGNTVGTDPKWVLLRISLASTLRT